jgi:hypothetical protein
MATYELRSLSLGEILDGAFAIYRHQFWTFVTIAIACEGIPTLVNAYVLMGGGWMMHPILGLVGFVRAIGAAYLGRQLPAGDALRFALGRIWPLFVAGTSAYLLIGLGAIALLVPGVILACGYSVIAQVVMLEDLPGGTDALPRSWQLTKGYKGKALGLGIVIMLLFLLPALVAGFLIVLFPVSEVVINIAGELFQMLVYPVFAAAFTLFYYDLRVRKEAFDVELLGHQLGLSDSATW